jgi:hypothetical protein
MTYAIGDRHIDYFRTKSQNRRKTDCACGTYILTFSLAFVSTPAECARVIFENSWKPTEAAGLKPEELAVERVEAWICQLYLATSKMHQAGARTWHHTDQDLIFRFYRELVKPDQAAKYWNIRPETGTSLASTVA